MIDDEHPLLSVEPSKKMTSVVIKVGGHQILLVPRSPKLEWTRPTGPIGRLLRLSLLFLYCLAPYSVCSPVAGLLDELLPASEVVRPAPAVHAEQQEAGEDQDGGRHVEAHLDPGHVLPQREEGRISRHHRPQPHAGARPHRVPVVRHQVSTPARTTFPPTVYQQKGSPYSIAERRVPELFTTKYCEFFVIDNI